MIIHTYNMNPVYSCVLHLFIHTYESLVMSHDTQ